MLIRTRSLGFSRKRENTMNKKDESDAVDPEDARPEGHYPRFRSNTWHYVPDELARTISLVPGGDGEEG